MCNSSPRRRGNTYLWCAGLLTLKWEGGSSTARRSTWAAGHACACWPASWCRQETSTTTHRRHTHAAGTGHSSSSVPASSPPLSHPPRRLQPLSLFTRSTSPGFCRRRISGRHCPSQTLRKTRYFNYGVFHYVPLYLMVNNTFYNNVDLQYTYLF